uniref:ER lumen protein-retaining receptor n=1 Tax=Solanum lycopersicum TaxID=4081 RepID=A0A3Q7I8G9_SOLLC
MNIFRLAGDMTHLASVLVLLLKIHTIKSCAGVSLKTQELYALVFVTRYLDIFTDFISLYNTTMKLVFLGSSLSIVWYMRHHKIVRRSYDKDQDTFRHVLLVVPCLVLALVIHEKFTFKEVMWTFSIFLEAVAILPQLVLLQRTRNIDNLTGQYILLLGYQIDRFASFESQPRTPFLLRHHSTATTFGYNKHIACQPTGYVTILRAITNQWRYGIINHSLISLFAFFIGDHGSDDKFNLTWFIDSCLAAHIAWIAGLIQTLLYADFFYYYFQSWKNNTKLELPA